MGLLDRLPFGGKKDADGDEEELKENIEKIRQKIQAEGDVPPPAGGTPAPDEEMQRPPREGEQAPGGPEGPQRPPTPRGQGRPGPEQEQGETEAPALPEPGRPQERQGPEGQPPRPGQAAGSQGAPAAGPTEEGGTDMPEPPELADLDSGDVEGGPLYVEVDTFRNALRALREMRQFSSDLDDHVGSVEGTLDEDRETAQGMADLLDSAEETTRRMRQLLHR